jgi:hypothetical protein
MTTSFEKTFKSLAGNSTLMDKAIALLGKKDDPVLKTAKLYYLNLILIEKINKYHSVFFRLPEI